MDKFQKSQIVKLSLLVLFFLITPLLSTSMRTPYLYFLLNLLIVVLGAESGFLSFLKPIDEKKPVIVVTNQGFTEPILTKVASVMPKNVESTPDRITDGVKEKKEKKVRKVEKSVSEKIVSVTKVQKVNKCPSMPSLFFIGGGDADEEESIEEVELVDEEGTLSGQELFTKAETFIGNFYKQLKIQRENSWKKIHGLYHKAF